ncbi:MAG TPA: alkaline phosphatase family protein [Jatrophihabitans sp.]|nr:alkaline phosphatase family protein [Jatrophihabitans sp.]
MGMWKRAACLAAATLTVTACNSASVNRASPPAASLTSVSTSAPAPTPTSTGPTARPAQAAGARHVVIVVMENHSYGEIIGNAQAPYINALGRRGKSLTQMYAITHPSEPNYLALFSGGTRGVTDDSCPHTFATNNLGHQLLATGRTFAGYSEGLPKTGSTVCAAGAYGRKHAPWVNFADLPASVNNPLTAFPTTYSSLPTVSFVIPNLNHDMHNGTIRQGDTWLQQHLGGYANWAVKHNSLLVVTWDEDDRSASNRIPTVIAGAGITPARISTHFTLYSLLRTIEDRYGLTRLGGAATARTIALN